MSSTIKIKRGLQTNLAGASASTGEPFYTTDGQKFYIYDGSSKVQVGGAAVANLSGTNTGDQTITLTGDVTGSGTGSFATTVAKIQTTTVSGTTGSTNVVFSGSPTIATPTITTSATAPLVIGGTGAASTLTLESTSGIGTTDSVIIKTGSQSTRATWFSNGGLILGSGAQISSSPGAGELALNNNMAIRWLNGASSSYLNVFNLDSSNNIQIGGGGATNDTVIAVGGVGTALTVTNTTGLVEVARNLKVDGIYSSPGTTDSSTTATRNNVDTSTSFRQFTGAAAITINNLAAGVDGQRFTIINNTANVMTFPYNDSTGGVGIPILNSTGASILLTNNGMLDFMYSTGHNGSNWYISGK